MEDLAGACVTMIRGQEIVEHRALRRAEAAEKALVRSEEQFRQLVRVAPDALFVVVRQMPEEFQAVDRRYCIKSSQEGFERNVMECDLSPSMIPQEQYDPPMRLRRSGGHH